MTDKRRYAPVLAASILAATICGSVSAATLYDNGAPNGTIAGENISGTNLNARADFFTLASASDVTGVTFASWDYPGSAMASVGWAIETSEDTTVALQTATTNSVYDFTNPNGYLIDENTFSTGNVQLAAGTYYLVLGNAVQTDGAGGYWDENDGPSQAFTGYNSPVGSSSFQILGAATVPEAPTWVMLLAGFGGLGFQLRRGPNREGRARG